MEEKRKSVREKTLWKVNIIEEQETEIFIGYLMDLSEGGAKFYIDKKKAKCLETKFEIKIKPPYDVNMTNRTIQVEKVWQRETHFFEMGVKFINLSKEDTTYLKLLLEYFNKDKKISIETEIIN